MTIDVQCNWRFPNIAGFATAPITSPQQYTSNIRKIKKYFIKVAPPPRGQPYKLSTSN